jgi:hypothetical protein
MLWTIGGLSTVACADVPANERVAVLQNVVAFEFIDEHGRAFETFPMSTGGSDTYRAYLEAKPEARYSIRARNLTGGRVGIVIAVDGRNIISGDRSDLGRREAMYILGPYESATYAGWRTTVSEVRRFYFTDVADSYAGRIGDESAMGVIAGAVYKERLRHTRFWQQRSGAAASASEPAPAAEAGDAASARERSAQAGTGFGESEHSQAIRVEFSPERRVSQRSFFKYEWPEQLCARGVKRCALENRFWPEPWQGFVPLPPGEHG